MVQQVMVANPANAFARGRNNALREALLQTSMVERKQAMQQRNEDQQWNREVRSRKRKQWQRQDREQQVLSRIDLTKPFAVNKPWIMRLSTDKQKQLLDYYANNDERERKRHADFRKLSQTLGARVLPMVRDEASYQAARQAIFEQIQNSGLVKPEELPELEKLFPAQYDPQWVATRLQAYGYKPERIKVAPGATVYNADTGTPEYTAPPKQPKAAQPPSEQKALTEIAKAQKEIAKLAQTGGFDALAFMVASPEERTKMTQAAQLNQEAKRAIQYYGDIIDYYKQFTKKDQQPTKQFDITKRYAELRDSGLSKEEAAAKLKEEVQNAGF